MRAVNHYNHLTRRRGSLSLCWLSVIMTISLGEEGAGCLGCDHLKGGRGSWSLCWLSSIVITSLGEEGTGPCAGRLSL